MQLSKQQIHDFKEVVWDYYHASARVMPWRQTHDPYAILVSELMLQQTQVSRVIPKFEAFLQAFPDVKTLAEAPLAKVLQLWSGLGYNRRAKYLWQAAKFTVEKCGGEVPDDYATLLQLPGVGLNTAGAIMAYAYNQPSIFIETNIRSVYFHHFFANQSQAVDDKLLRQLVDQTLDRENPREWYWALMDYGTHLKAQTGGYLSTSRHYVRQSTFQGSHRQMRGAIIKALSQQSYQPATLKAFLAASDDPRFEPALADLVAEQLVSYQDKILRLTDQ